MATLTGQTILSTYQSLLKIGDNGSITSTLTTITDGLGNNTPISISTTAISTSTDILLNNIVAGRGAGNIFNNTAFGAGSLSNNTSGNKNVAMGYTAMAANTTGTYNTAIGDSVLANCQTGTYNTSIGRQSLFNNGTGSKNSTCGYTIMFYNTSGSNNQVLGYGSMLLNTTGSYNNAVGYYALYGNTIGNYNTGAGAYVLYSNTTGTDNVAIGAQAGYGPDPGTYANTTGNNNIFIGNYCGGVSATDSNRSFIGTPTTTSTWLAGNLLLGTKTDAGYIINAVGTGKFTTGLFVSPNATMDTSAISQIDSTTKGFIIPRMTDAQILAIATPANGLMVYSTSQNVLCFYDSTGWHKFTHTNL